MSNYLKLFGELMNDLYYIMSPYILGKLFLLTIIIADVESTMLSIASICVIIMCSSTSIYRVFKISIKIKNE